MSEHAALRSRLGAQLAACETGQGMVEYGLILVAVAVVVVVALFAIGPRVASMFSTAALSLG
jgi:Flp pilus assembly pilin Flp